MKKLLLLLMVLFLWAGTSWGATVQIGSGTGSTSSTPIFSCYGYSYTQQIFTQAQISAAAGGAGAITKLRFNFQSGSSANNLDWVVYIGNTTKTTFSSATDWVPVSAMTQVFASVVTYPAAGNWLEITFSTGFSWDGTSNIVVAVDENTSGYYCSNYWLSFTSGSNTAIYYRNDSTNPDPASPPSASGRTSTINQIQFEMQPSALPPPCTTVVSPADASTGVLPTATLNWGVLSAATGYRLSFGTDNPPTNILNNSDVGNVTTYIPSPALGYSTTYYWKVVPYNANGSATGCSTWSFTTGPNPAITTFPACESFDATTFPPYGWTTVKTAGTGTPALWFRTTSGSSPSCSPHSGAGMTEFNSYSYASGTTGILVTPPINFPTDLYRVTFWIYRDAAYLTTPDLVNVYYNGSAPSSNGATLLGTINRSINLAPVVSTAGWYQYVFNMPAGATGNGRYVIFEAVAQDGDNIFMDDICLEQQPACPSPSTLTAVPYGHQATLGWTEMGTAASWDVENMLATATPTGTPTNAGVTNPFIQTGLTPLTAYKYYVRANCGSGSLSTWSGPYNYTTTVSCPAPTNLTAAAITLTGATVNWTPGLETSWDIEYGPAGFTAGSGTGYTEVLGTSTKPYAITGILPSTVYNFYVKANCGTGDVSLWSAKGTFTTLCDAVSTFPWTEGFENMPTVGLQILPPCWSYENVAGTFGPYSSNTSGTYSGPHNGTNFIYTEYMTTTWVYTPGMVLNGATSYDFSFYMMNKDITSPIDFLMDVAYGSAQASASMTNVLATGIVCSNSSYVQFKYTFTPPASGTYYFGVKTTSATSTPWEISFDDFRFEPTPSCLPPTLLTNTGVTTHSAVLDWTNGGTEGLWNIKYGAPGFNPVTGGTLISNVAAHPYTLNPPLTASTTYDWYVQANCGGGSLSPWSGPQTFTTLCDNVTVFPFSESFDGTTFPPACWAVTQVSGTGNWARSTAGSYPTCTPHTGAGMAYFNSFDFTTGCTSALITPALNLPADSYLVKFWMYRDDGYSTNADLVNVFYNTSASVTGATLLGTINRYINSAPVETGGNGWYQYTMTLPVGSAGNSRFVIFEAVSAYGNNIFVDDVNIDVAPPCPAPTGLSATPSTTSANLQWDVLAATSWDIEWGATPYTYTGIPQITGTTDNPFLLSPLFPATGYTYKVRGHCSGGLTSDWSNAFTFTTKCLSSTIPYTENFDGVTAPAIPTCMLVTDNNADGVKWLTSTSYPRSTPNSMYIGYNYSVAMNDWFFSPPLDLGVGVYKVSFWYRSEGASFPEKLQVKWGNKADAAFMTNGPIFDNNNIASATYVEGDGFLTVTTAGTYYVGWHGYSDADEYYLLVDDISITQALAHDVGTISINNIPGALPPSTPITPTATVQNFGSNMETFPVTLKIGSYTSTQTVTGLAMGATQVVTFDPWTPALGTYTAMVYTDLSTDLDRTNDTIKKSVVVKNAVKIYACNAYDPTSVLPNGPVYFYDISPGTITSLATGTEAMFIEAGSWVNGIWYGSDYYDNDPTSGTYGLGGGWYTIDPTTGAMTMITNLGRSFCGIAYDHTNNILYGVDYNGTSNDVYTIIPATGAATLLGTEVPVTRDGGPN